jgi:hypothetical protein
VAYPAAFLGVALGAVEERLEVEPALAFVVAKREDPAFLHLIQ